MSKLIRWLCGLCAVPQIAIGLRELFFKKCICRCGGVCMCAHSHMCLFTFPNQVKDLGLSITLWYLLLISTLLAQILERS